MEQLTSVTNTNAAAFDGGRDDVFSRIASRYDLLCDLFSLGIHRSWKRRMASYIRSASWQRMLDVAAGTGDIAIRVARSLGAETLQSCTVSDICPAMLAIAKRRAGPLAHRLQFQTLDAHALTPVDTASVDLYSISLGLKICDRKRVLAEAWRVLRPGGNFICLEASQIPLRLVYRAYLTYMNLCLPAIGWVATGGDAAAYGYLLRGVHNFPDAENFVAELVAQGLVDVSFERLSFGIMAIHVATKPSAAPD